MPEAAEDLRHPHRQRDGAAGTAGDDFPDLALQLGQVDDRQAERAEDLGCGVDGVIVGRVERGGGNDRDDADDAFDQHGAVADRPDVAFLSTIFEVVPVDTSPEPEIAPQAS